MALAHVRITKRGLWPYSPLGAISVVMKASYEEIETEWKSLSARRKGTLPPEAKAVMTAFWQHCARLAIVSRCIHCNELLSVTDVGKAGQAWVVSCPCGRSKDTLRGL